MNSLLKKEHIIEFQSNGVVVLKNVIDDYLIEHLNNLIDEIKNNNINYDTLFDINHNKIRRIYQTHLKHKEFQNIFEELRPVIDKLLGVQDGYMKSYGSMIIENNVQEEDGCDPHQDLSYIEFIGKPYNSVSVWIAFDDANELNGCLWYKLGSHKEEYKKHMSQPCLNRIIPNTNNLDNVHSLNVISSEIPCEDFVAYPVKKGDIIFHHCKTIHMSKHNISTFRRRAYSLMYIPK
jgi:ectoine hydroxylase-related dioxygenase (phytanoyl-CoA dioxygenase family)